MKEPRDGIKTKKAKAWKAKVTVIYYDNQPLAEQGFLLGNSTY